MRIERIESVPSSKEAFNVCFENAESIKCYVKELSDFGLCPGLELDGEILDQFTASARLSCCKDRAARLLARRSMSRGELERKLTEKGEDPDDAADAVQWLCERGFIDEQRYAETIVSHYSAKAYGTAKIMDELRKRYIPRELWDDAFECSSRSVDEPSAIDLYIDRKLRGAIADRAAMKKLGDSLYRRGYSWNEISDAFRRYKDKD